MPGNLGFAVWYPKRPVLNVNLSIGVGKSPAGWRCHRLTLTFEASVLEQGGWPNALRQLWRCGRRFEIQLDHVADAREQVARRFWNVLGFHPMQRTHN